MRQAAIAAFLAVAIGSAVSARQAVPKELAPLQGTWVLESVNGQGLAALGVTADITFTGNKYAASLNGIVNESGTIKVDASKKPMTIDFMIETGSPNTVNKTQLGLIEIGATTLRFHLNQAGVATRPADFQPLPGHDLIVVKKKT